MAWAICGAVVGFMGSLDYPALPGLRKFCTPAQKPVALLGAVGGKRAVNGVEDIGIMPAVEIGDNCVMGTLGLVKGVGARLEPAPLFL